MGAVTDYASRKMLQSLFIPDAHSYIAEFDGNTWSGDFYVALAKTAPILGTGAASLSEPTASSYARAKYGIGSSYWQVINHSAVANTRSIYFNAPAEDWGIISGWALCTALTDGEVIAHGALDPVRIIKGSIVNIHANGLVISVVS